MLLHLVDIAPLDPEADPVRDARAIVARAQEIQQGARAKPRWLVLNKRDLLPPVQAEKRARAIVRRLRLPRAALSHLRRNGRGDAKRCARPL